MEIQETIGIDVSKLFFDAFIHSVKKHKRFKNTPEGFTSMSDWVRENTKTPESKQLYAFEHTGLYSLPLSVYLSSLKNKFILIPGLELKRSTGLARGKDDVIDAKAIALYAYRRREEITPYKLPSPKLLELRYLLRLREKLVKQRAGFIVTEKETIKMLGDTVPEIYIDIHGDMIRNLSEQIKKIEKAMRDIVRGDEEIKNQFDLITSIQGVGEQTALFMIVFTSAFTLFENSRKFASYAGVAPFPYQSGTSIRGKTKTSNLANKKFKSLLSNCASSAKVHNSEIKQYYQRKLSEGKHKMSVLNSVRNKLLSRIFAVIKRGTPHADTMGFAS